MSFVFRLVDTKRTYLSIHIKYIQISPKVFALESCEEQAWSYTHIHIKGKFAPYHLWLMFRLCCKKHCNLESRKCPKLALISFGVAVHSLLKSAFNTVAIEKEKIKQILSEQEQSDQSAQIHSLRKSLSQVKTSLKRHSWWLLLATTHCCCEACLDCS